MYFLFSNIDSNLIFGIFYTGFRLFWDTLYSDSTASTDPNYDVYTDSTASTDPNYDVYTDSPASTDPIYDV